MLRLRSLCFTRCICVGSDGGDNPALLTATMRNWYSPRSFRSTTLPSSLSPGTSPAFSQSGLNLSRGKQHLLCTICTFGYKTGWRPWDSVCILVFFLDYVFLDGNASIYGWCCPLQVDTAVVIIDDIGPSRGRRLFCICKWKCITRLDLASHVLPSTLC